MLPLVIAAVMSLLWLPRYMMEAPPYLGLPWGVSLWPPSLCRYFAAYWHGRADAKKDVQNGHLAVEVYGGPGFLVPLFHELKERYGVEARPVAACVVDDQILGHAAGYNRISAAEVKRRFGVNIIDPVGRPATQPLQDAAQTNALKN